MNKTITRLLRSVGSDGETIDVHGETYRSVYSHPASRRTTIIELTRDTLYVAPVLAVHMVAGR